MNRHSHIAAALLVFGLSAGPLSAQDWGNKMLDKLEINFGSVARMAETTFKLKVTNPYVETIQITNLTTSCGCISWLDQTPISIPSRGEHELTIRLDTVRHVGEKHVRAFVTLSEPTKGLTALVQIPVNGRIRDDFEVRPGSVTFGNVDQGQAQSRTISVNSTGASNWKLLTAKSDSVYVNTRIAPKQRTDGLTQYDVVIDLMPDAPTGLLRDRLVLTTNEPGNPQITLPIEAKIEPDVIATDAHFGAVTPGHPKSVIVIIRGKKPIQLEKISHAIQQTSAKPDASGVIQAGGTYGAARPNIDVTNLMKVDFDKSKGMIQKVTLTLDPSTESESGLFDELYSVNITGRAEPLSFHVNGRISPKLEADQLPPASTAGPNHRSRE